MLLPPSFQSLFIELRFDEQVLGTGTAFVAMATTGPVLITNRHNLTGLNNKTGECLHHMGGIPNNIIIMHNSNEVGTWIRCMEKLTYEEKPLWIEHPHFGKIADFVALPISVLKDVKVYPYELETAVGQKIMIGPSDTISVVGFPFGIAGGGSLAIWATGFVASEPEVDFEDLPVFLIDCRARPGQSGSAVIAQRNGGSIALEGGGYAASIYPITRFLGIYSGRLNEQSDLGIVWKASAIKELVDSIK